MEFSVYDGGGKRVRLAIFGALVAGMVASFTTVFLASQGAAARGGRGLPEQFPILVLPAVLIVGLVLIMVTLAVRIRIERGMGEVSRVYSQLGCASMRPYTLSPGAETSPAMYLGCVAG